MIHIPTKEAVVFQNTPCESAVEYRSEQKLTSPFLSILCVTEKKNEIMEEHLKWSLKIVSPDAAKWQFMFTVFPSECWYTVSPPR